MNIWEDVKKLMEALEGKHVAVCFCQRQGLCSYFTTKVPKTKEPAEDLACVWHYYAFGSHAVLIRPTPFPPFFLLYILCETYTSILYVLLPDVKHKENIKAVYHLGML